MFSRSLFQKEGFEIWGCFFVSELKLRSTSSSEKNFADDITWITWKTEQNLEIWPFLNSRLEMWVWESGRKIDPATSVRTRSGMEPGLQDKCPSAQRLRHWNTMGWLTRSFGFWIINCLNLVLKAGILKPVTSPSIFWTILFVCTRSCKMD